MTADDDRDERINQLKPLELCEDAFEALKRLRGEGQRAEIMHIP